jgi:hypothetical protein
MVHSGYPANLNVPRPSGEIPLLTKLEPFVAEICDLPVQQLYRIDKCLYGLPDFGRHFYRHYRDALIAEGHVMSKMDNCLFYRVNDVETTFIVLFVDDTLIFSKRQEDIDQFSARLNRHYELTLDAKADSFLGILIVQTCAGTQCHNYQGTITAHTSNTVGGVFDVLNQESTRHHDGCLLRGY